MKRLCAALVLACIAILAWLGPSFGSELAISPLATATYITGNYQVSTQGNRIRLCVTVEKTAVSNKQSDLISAEDLHAMHEMTMAACKHVVHHTHRHLHAVRTLVNDAGLHLGSHLNSLGHHAHGFVASCVYSAQHHRAITALAEHAKYYSDSAGNSFKNICMDQISKVTVLLTPPSA